MPAPRQPVAPLTTRAPLLAPAVALVLGSWLAARALPLPVPLLVAVAAGSAALGRRSAWWLACLALGLVWAEVRWAAPRRELAKVVLARPVHLTGEVAGCWSADEAGESAWLSVRRVRQGRWSRSAAGRVRVHAPAGEEPRGCGGAVRVRGFLRPPRSFRNAVPVTVGGWSVWVKSAALMAETERPDVLARASTSLRRRLFAADPGEGRPRRENSGREEREGRDAGEVGERADGADAAPSIRPGLTLARAFLLGDGRALPAEQREAMRRLGLAHLVAVSGLNVGMVASALLLLLLRAPRPVRLLGTLAGIAGYALLVGPLPSLLRALVMAAVVLLALLLRRLPAAVNALAAACLLLVLLDPSWVDDLGFQLSVAATVGLMALAPPLVRLLRPCGWLATPLAVTIAAQVATLPWALAGFHRLSPAAPLANLVAVPWAAAALAVALVWALARLAVGPLADPLLGFLDALAWPLALLERVPASPWVTLPATAGWPCAVAATVLLGWTLVRPQPRWAALGRCALATALVLAAQPRAQPEAQPRGGARSLTAVGGGGGAAAPAVEVAMLDVGQGDALLLRDGEAALLVDGGGWRGPGFGGRVLVPALVGLGVRSLLAIAVTHGDDDHCGGAADLVRELPVVEVWVPDGLRTTDCGRRLETTSGPTVRELSPGSVERVGRWRLDVLGPAPEDSGDNGRSLVLRATAAGRCVLLTGDLEARGERALVARLGASELACEVLKVAHHGSHSSSTRPFLQAVAPRLALVSAGAGNAYGHPAPPVLAALRRVGAKVWRTDRHGMVRLRWTEFGPLHVTVAAP